MQVELFDFGFEGHAAIQNWTPEQLSDLHVLIKFLGQTVCRHDVTNCRRCPVSGGCEKALTRQSAVAA